MSMENSRRRNNNRHAGVVSESQWLPPVTVRTLLVSSDAYLQEEAKRIVAAAGGELWIAADEDAATRHWDSSDVVLVGSDIKELPPRRRPPTVLLGRNGEGDSLWGKATALGAERVAVLPDAAAWLAEYLLITGSPEPGGVVTGVIGGCGGAGASTTAVWLAQAAAAHGISTLLVDGDPWGGGLELAVTDHDVPGLRWPDFAETVGSIDPTQFRDSLPVVGGFSCLSWPGTPEAFGIPGSRAVEAVMDAARRGFELTVVDVGRDSECIMGFAWGCDTMLLQCLAYLKPAVAAARVLSLMPYTDAGLLIRGNASASVDPVMIAESLGVPLKGVVPEVRGVPEGMEAGRLLDFGRRKQVRRFADAVLNLPRDGAAPETGFGVKGAGPEVKGRGR
ncbi:septum site-determining protein Ssd [Paenarthrobacter ilicis]|uniref:Secretion/DNA translocation related CpaE-like protein n=1 Tax=Paenarthrobacter ilicis TaxID=43665 RepID=A0ABX0TDD1_9MICC|nr:septum site-determining protein Ssd [Paenarthrobacter ilicis]MBM7794304.1 secretion/DNA translocation related CpaE-like protein [Paenarthrobacter ilicis]NIJ00484.1 secretion/DNA translocation related CpaE-like protein [Paenarthrobacter ilicis]